MKYAIRAILSCALVLGCAPDIDDPDTLRECDSETRCWLWRPGWGAWSQYYPDGHLDAYDELVPAYAGDACWRMTSTSLPICEVEVDDALVHGFPIDIAADLHDIHLQGGVCGDRAPFESVDWTRGQCYGVISGVAVRLDLQREVPADFEP